MSTPIDIDMTLDASGGTTDEVSQQAALSTDAAAVQVAISGPSTSVDIHVQTRLADDLGWADLSPSSTGVAGGYNSLDTFDVADFGFIRVRIVNQDGTSGNTADVRAVLTTR